MDSPAFQYLHEATLEVIGESKPFSICGSLPLVGDLQKAGFDIQVHTMLTNCINFIIFHSRLLDMVTVMCIMVTMSTAVSLACRML